MAIIQSLLIATGVVCLAIGAALYSLHSQKEPQTEACPTDPNYSWSDRSVSRALDYPFWSVTADSPEQCSGLAAVISREAIPNLMPIGLHITQTSA